MVEWYSSISAHINIGNIHWDTMVIKWQSDVMRYKRNMIRIKWDTTGV